MADENVVLTDIINSRLKTGNKTANIIGKNCSLFIHTDTVNGDGSKTEKIIKRQC